MGGAKLHSKRCHVKSGKGMCLYLWSGKGFKGVVWVKLPHVALSLLDKRNGMISIYRNFLSNFLAPANGKGVPQENHFVVTF